MARLAKSLVVLRDQIDQVAPDRSKSSDGWIGDAAHKSRKSDHNPDPDGVVHALDITHDPAHGIDGTLIVESLRASGDPRISYIIWRGRISNPRIQGGAWRASHGHTLHFHVSVLRNGRDSDRPWAIGTNFTPQPQAKPAISLPVLRRGSRGDAVRELQKAIGLPADGVFGPKTEMAVRVFQKKQGIKVDGVVGGYTWEKLGL